MSAQWDFYLRQGDDKPASIFFDMGLAGNAPIRSQPHMACVRIFLRQARPDGLSSNEEFDDLAGVEKSLELAFASEEVTYAGRITSGGNRDCYFYTSRPAAFAKSVESAMARHPRFRYEVRNRPDPEWDVYFSLLYPSPDDLQRILNRRLTDSLVSHGDDLSVARQIDHFAYLPNAKAAANLRELLVEQRFVVDNQETEGGTVSLSFNRSDRPDRIDDVVVPIARSIRGLGGEYDGWGCKVVAR